MTFDPSSRLSRTAAGDAELSIPANGLSLGQRKLLSYLAAPQAFDELATRHAFDAEKLDRDLAKLVALKLASVDGHDGSARIQAAASAPGVAGVTSVVLGGWRAPSVLRWLLLPLLVGGATLVYLAFSTSTPDKSPTALAHVVTLPVAAPASPTTPPTDAAVPRPNASAPAAAPAPAPGEIASADERRSVPAPAALASVATAASPATAAAAVRHPTANETVGRAVAAEVARSSLSVDASRPMQIPIPAGATKSVPDATTTATPPLVADGHPSPPAAPAGPAIRPTTANQLPPPVAIDAGAAARTQNQAQPKPLSAAAAAPASSPVAQAPAPVKASAPPANAAVAAAPATPPTRLAMAAPTAATAHPPATTRLMPLTRTDPEFPREAMVRGVWSGSVKARLAIDASGKVTAVDIVQSQPGRVFDRAVTQALSRWTFAAGDAGRSTEVEVAFKRD